VCSMSKVKEAIGHLKTVAPSFGHLLNAREGTISGGVVGTKMRDAMRIVDKTIAVLESMGGDAQKTSVIMKLLLDEGKSTCPVCDKEKEGQNLFLLTQRGEEPPVNEITVCLQCIQAHGAKALAGKRISVEVGPPAIVTTPTATSSPASVSAPAPVLSVMPLESPNLSDVRLSIPPAQSVLRGGEILPDPFGPAQ